MRIYFSGIGGVGIGPLALIAKDMGHDVVGSDLHESRYTKLIQERDVNVHIGQDGSQIEQAHQQQPIDWLVITSALPKDHPEITFASSHNIRISKRDELLNQLIAEKQLKLIAVSGTHGKTSTTGMLIWCFKQLGVPVSYSIGTDISFGPSGQYAKESEYFVYEADEYDRNFLKFKPYVSIIPSIDYDHPDIFPTEEDYQSAFVDFINASHCSFLWREDAERLGLAEHACLHVSGADDDISTIKLAGEHNRRNAWLAHQTLRSLMPDIEQSRLLEIIAQYPGVGRRFERIAPNIYSDYAHHPVEIAATIQQALEMNDRVTIVYQPHQNKRQHEVKDQYADAFTGAQTVYWLPTYLSREDPALAVIQPQEFIDTLSNKDAAQPAEMNDDLKAAVKQHATDGVLVLLMSAGTLDEWARRELA